MDKKFLLLLAPLLLPGWVWPQDVSAPRRVLILDYSAAPQQPPTQVSPAVRRRAILRAKDYAVLLCTVVPGQRQPAYKQLSDTLSLSLEDVAWEHKNDNQTAGKTSKWLLMQSPRGLTHPTWILGDQASQSFLQVVDESANPRQLQSKEFPPEILRTGVTRVPLLPQVDNLRKNLRSSGAGSLLSRIDTKWLARLSARVLVLYDQMDWPPSLKDETLIIVLEGAVQLQYGGGKDVLGGKMIARVPPNFGKLELHRQGISPFCALLVTVAP